ncbi:MAG: hypothetical protein Q7T76_11330 [Ferruginibacter sp.]|nr:hypothetical protein [Ferruginibacter sp.]
MKIESTTPRHNFNYETILVLITCISMLVSASTFQTSSCGCAASKNPLPEGNTGLKDFFFKYPNL